MFVAAYEVLDLTGATVSEALVARAQAIIEMTAGRTEGMFWDANSPDYYWMSYATAWQAAYMVNDPAAVYEQANLVSAKQDNSTLVFGDRLYALAPLAAQAITRLSWRGSRGLHTGPTVGRVDVDEWESV